MQELHVVGGVQLEISMSRRNYVHTQVCTCALYRPGHIQREVKLVFILQKKKACNPVVGGEV